MKTLTRIIFISLLMMGYMVCTIYADNGNKTSQVSTIESIALTQNAEKMAKKWAKDLQLTKEQQSQLKEVTATYLIKRQEILGKVKNNTKKIKLSEEQKASMREISYAYTTDIDSILTEEQKATLETIKEEQRAENQEKAQQAVKEAIIKKDN